MNRSLAIVTAAQEYLHLCLISFFEILCSKCRKTLSKEEPKPTLITESLNKIPPISCKVVTFEVLTHISRNFIVESSYRIAEKCPVIHEERKGMLLCCVRLCKPHALLKRRLVCY